MAIKKYISGWRHPFLGRYRVAHDSSGRVLAADVELYNNAFRNLLEDASQLRHVRGSSTRIEVHESPLEGVDRSV